MLFSTTAQIALLMWVLPLKVLSFPLQALRGPGKHFQTPQWSSQSDSGSIRRWDTLENSSWKLTMCLTGFDDRPAVDPVTISVRLQLLPVEDDGLAPVKMFGPPSTFITKGFVWSTAKGLDSNSDDKSTYLMFNLRGEKLDPCLPDGSIYVNARITRRRNDGSLRLEDGVVTFKRPKKTSFLFFSYDGLLAEFKVVGSCTLVPISPPD